MPQVNPLVSVIIPVFNTGRYIAEAIDSVLNQSYEPIEILVIDDGSTDNTSVIVNRYLESVQYYFQENRGTGTARNRGTQLAHGEFFAFLDADDIWLPEKLSEQMRAFEADDKTGIVFGQVEQFYSADISDSVRQKISISPRAVPGHIPSAFVIRRDVFFHVGLFDTRLQVGEFEDWFARAIEQEQPMATIPQLVTRRRIHDNNKGIVCRQHFHQRLAILKASLDRRRRRNLGEFGHQD